MSDDALYAHSNLTHRGGQMKSNRLLSVSVLALALGLGFHSPATANAQQARVVTTKIHTYICPADVSHEVRTTISAPDFQFQSGASEAEIPYYITIRTLDGDVTHVLEPGGSFSFTIDPRSVGQVVDERTGLRHVRVELMLQAEVIEGQPVPEAAVTIEIVNRRTREVKSFQAYAGGYTGTVQFSSGDTN